MTKIVNSMIIKAFDDLFQGISAVKSAIADLDNCGMGVIDIKIDNHDVVVHVFNTNRFMKLFPNYKSIPMRTNDYGYTHRLEAEINGIKIIALRSVEREVV